MKWTSGSRPMKQRARRWSRSVPPVASSGSEKALTPSAGVSSPTCHQTVASPSRASSVPTAGTGGSAAARAPSWMRRPRSGRSSAESSASATRGSVAAPPAAGVSAAKERTRAGEVRRAGEHQPRGAGRDGGAARQSQHEDPVNVVGSVRVGELEGDREHAFQRSQHPSLTRCQPTRDQHRDALARLVERGRDQVVGHHISQRAADAVPCTGRKSAERGLVDRACAG